MKMKKTLLALAVVTYSMVSGSVMAGDWTTSGTGGSVDFGGSLTPVAKVTPWEVQVGSAVNGLNADITKGQSAVDISVNQAIPVLGIRTTAEKIFNGQSGISPQIDFKGAVDIDGFSNGKTTLTLDVKNDKDQKIGEMTTRSFVAGAESSWKTSGGSGKKYLSAGSAGQAFFGGLAKNTSQIGNGWDLVQSIDPEYQANYDAQGAKNLSAAGSETFSNTASTFSGYYGAGIQAGSVIHITLDTPAAGDAPIAWKASLPVTVSYQ
ncbi:hypothetical protein [Escherichia coli]|uniref:F4 family fimbrial subunit n=1 Tax=Escherichia coli TaxID=562 RepID=UPI0038B40F77